MAHQPINAMYVHHIAVVHVHHRQSQADAPDDGTGQLSMAGLASPADIDGMYDSQVSVKADAGQEKHPTIDVQGEQRSSYFTHEYTENPLVDPLDGEKWQRYS